jgi:protein-L-isoaspartate(D-aspartate) O-methyltransferase
MIAIMLEELHLRKGLKVLEVGAGSGYNAALLYETVESKVFTVERLRRLIDLSRSNLRASGYQGKVEVIEGDGTKGYGPERPYDRILVTAGAPAIPRPLVEQLAVDGILGIPVGGHQSYQEFITGVKGSDGSFKTKSHGGCAFVPLIGEHGWGE